MLDSRVVDVQVNLLRVTASGDLLLPPEFDGAPAIHPGGLSFTAVNEDGTESRVITLEKLPGATRLRTELLLR